MKIDKRSKWLDIGIMAIIIVFSCLLTWNLAKAKPGMMLDEYFSFGLANSTFETNQGKYDIFLPQGVAEEPKEFFDKYFFATGFSLQDVWLNQSYDVHPPVFYLMIHVLGRLTHNRYGFEIGILLNIILLIFNVLIIYVLIYWLTTEKKWAFLGAAWYGFVPVVLQSAIYIRMYHLLSCLFLLLILFMCLGYRYWDVRCKYIIPFYILLGMQSVLGVLTHYYYVIFLFWVCALWFFVLAFAKRWKEVCLFVVTMLTSGALSFLIFPAMKDHVLSGNRGQESIDSLLHSNFIGFFTYYGKILAELFGGLILPLGIAIFVLWAVTRRKREERKSEVSASEERKLYGWNKVYGFIFVPVLMYLITISKIGVIRSSRFITPICGAAIVLLVLLLYMLQNRLESGFAVKKNLLFTISCLLVVLSIGYGWLHFTWNELSTDHTKALEMAKQYGPENDCFYVWELSEDCMVCYDELCQYNQVYFWNKDTQAEEMSAVTNVYDHLVVYFNCIGQLNREWQENLLTDMVAQNEKLTKFSLFYEDSMNCAYYVE